MRQILCGLLSLRLVGKSNRSVVLGRFQNYSATPVKYEGKCGRCPVNQGDMQALSLRHNVGLGTCKVLLSSEVIAALEWRR